MVGETRYLHLTQTDMSPFQLLSKYACVIPLKNKTGPLLVEAFKRIFASGRKPIKEPNPSIGILKC